jgi:hypothetical protein
VQIYFFTYDEIVQEYDFSGDEVKCTILDPSIGNSLGKRSENFLQNIRVNFNYKIRKDYLIYWTVCRRWLRITRSRGAILSRRSTTYLSR